MLDATAGGKDGSDEREEERTKTHSVVGLVAGLAGLCARKHALACPASVMLHDDDCDLRSRQAEAHLTQAAVAAAVAAAAAADILLRLLPHLLALLRVSRPTVVISRQCESFDDVAVWLWLP